MDRGAGPPGKPDPIDWVSLWRFQTGLDPLLEMRTSFYRPVPALSL